MPTQFKEGNKKKTNKIFVQNKISRKFYEGNLSLKKVLFPNRLEYKNKGVINNTSSGLLLASLDRCRPLTQHKKIIGVFRQLCRLALTHVNL